jgi:L-ribulose-5-phosphate 4-epimerase
MLLENQRRKVIEIAQKAYHQNLLPLTMGNFSLRDEESGLICITPSGMEYASLNPKDMIIMDVDGTIIDGMKKPSTEWQMHCHVYNNRKDIFGIVHTHSEFATAWACCGLAIPVVVAELASHVGGPVTCAPYRPMGTEALAEIVVQHLEDRYAVLMANHGVLCVGPDINAAFTNALMVEEGAKIAYYAKQIGQLNEIPESECIALKCIAAQKYGQK